MGVLFGSEREREMPGGCEALTWRNYGQEEIPASLGITVGSEAQVNLSLPGEGCSVVLRQHIFLGIAEAA